VTPAYGYHIDENRAPGILVRVDAALSETSAFGALGKAIGEKLEATGLKHVPFIEGVANATLEELKSFCASIATFGGAALFHMPGITPEANRHEPPHGQAINIQQADIDRAFVSMNDARADEIDFVSLGCPHLSLTEIAHLAELLDGKRVKKEFWITTARPIKQIADRAGYSAVIEASGAKFAVDTCCVVAPIKERFKTLATDSAKACYYAYAKNKFKTVFKPFDEVVQEALQ
jgi:hypothetical protein